jgi:starch-binding outer membrane protein, SusD/RagB family
MKKYIYRLLLLIVISFGACTDLIEEPVGLLAPESMFKTPKDVQTAINGTYGRIASESYYGRKLTLTLQLLSDMCDIGDRGTPARRQQINNFVADANNGMITAFWPRSYEIISAANAALNGADLIEGDEAELNSLRAEARFVRAFVYYNLVRIFGEIPYIDFFVNDPEAVKTISKTPVNEIYTGIIADFEFAKQHLPDKQPNNTRFRPSKGTAAAYLASVALTRKDYPKAAEEAKWVITNKGRFGVELMADYQDVFNATLFNSENLFAVDFASGISGSGNEGQHYMAPLTGIRGSDDLGWSVNVPSMAVYNSWDDRDYRKSVAFDATTLVNGVEIPYTEYANTQRPHIAKFMRFHGNSPSGDGANGDLNYTAMRYAEVLLIAAEAINENSGPTAEAIGFINQIRQRARNAAGQQNNFPEDVATGISKEDFRNLVIEERRLELSFEWKRWFDIKRLAIGDEVFKGPDSLEPHTNFDSGKHYLLPVPQREIDTNPNLLPQNPGY